jgi:hypothetical protein
MIDHSHESFKVIRQFLEVNFKDGQTNLITFRGGLTSWDAGSCNPLDPWDQVAKSTLKPAFERGWLNHSPKAHMGDWQPQFFSSSYFLYF